MKRWITVLLFGACVAAQTATSGGDKGGAAVASPTIRNIRCHQDGSCGGRLHDAEGVTNFHIGVSATACDLSLGTVHGGGRKSRRLPRGSAAEVAFLARLVAWSQAAFPAKQRAALLADMTLLDDAARGQDEAFLRQCVVNRLAHFQRIRTATITSVFHGRSTVALTVKVRDGLGDSHLVMFRRLDDGKLRIYLGDATDAIPLDSLRDRIVGFAIQRYADAELAAGVQDLLWKGAKIRPAEAKRDPVKVVATWIAYRNETCPRVMRTYMYLDGGSTLYELVDARGREFRVRFDKRINSGTIGRMWIQRKDAEEVLVPFSSKEESYLLEGFDAHLARGGQDDRDVLADLLAGYRDLREAEKK